MDQVVLEVWRKNEDDCGQEWRAWGVNCDAITASDTRPVSYLSIWAQSR